MSAHSKNCGCVDCSHRASPIADHLAARSAARPDGCVIFTGKLRADGYGRLIRNGMEYRAHRVALALRLGYADGVLPLDVVVRHQCDNPPCVNPDHLLVGSQADNMRDAKVRGRSKGPHSWSVDALGVLRCSKGHDLSADRSIEASSDGSRRCLLCRQEKRGSTPRRFRNGRVQTPSEGQMLREWQALTALAEYAQHDGMCGASQAYGPITCDCGLDAARAALEAVRGD